MCIERYVRLVAGSLVLLSLVLAQSGALRSFGWAAVLGEAMAILMVLLVLPTLLGPRWAERPEEPGTPGTPGAEPERST